MIRANKRGLFARLVAGYVRRKVRRSFRAIWSRTELTDFSGPLLVYANHTSFWDGFIAQQLCEAAGWDGYCLMEEDNLRRYPFLARLGAFSVRRSDPKSALPAFRYAKDLLARPSSAVFLFPEGDIHPFGAGPLELKPGLVTLSRLAHARCLPLAIRYTFFEHELPDVLIAAGPLHVPEPLESCRDRLEQLTRELAQVHSLSGFVPLTGVRRGVAERWDAVKEAVR